MTGRRLRALLSRRMLRAYHKAMGGRVISFEGLKLYVPRGVFNPLLTGSTLMLARTMHPEGRVIDIGTGTGVLALLAARLPEVEIAVGYDESKLPVATARLNARINKLEGKTVFTHSWRRAMSYAPFDSALINPPYLPLEPRDPLDNLWCGGRDLRVVRSILIMASQALRKRGRIWITCSTLSPWRTLAFQAEKIGILLRLCSRLSLIPDTIIVLCGESIGIVKGS